MAITDVQSARYGALLRTAANELMSAEADTLCGAGLGEVSDQRVDRRCGYRARNWTTAAGTIRLAIPRLRAGSYTPGWLLEDPARAERALTALVNGSSGIPVRRVRRVIKKLGVTGIGRNRAALIAETLNRQAEREGVAHPGYAPPAADTATAAGKAVGKTELIGTSGCSSWRIFVPYAVLGTAAVVLLGRVLAPIRADNLLLILLVIMGFFCAALARWARHTAGADGR